MEKHRNTKKRKGYLSTEKLSNMTVRDIKREAIALGMPFPEIITSGIPNLSNYIQKHFYEEKDYSLLDKFDDWHEEEIRKAVKARGGKRKEAEELIHPMLRLGFIGERDEDGTIITTRKIKGCNTPNEGGIRKVRMKTSQNIVMGTKKAYTFELTNEGLEKKEVIKKVKAKYPEASDKSIGIWYNKAKKLDGKVNKIKGKKV